MTLSTAVRQLTIYPIKSCAGIDVKQAIVEQRGFRYDRRWMIVDSNRQFLTQRTHPTLSLVQTRFADGAIELSAPRFGSMRLPLVLPEEPSLEAQVWGEKVRVVPGPTTVATWFSEFLGLRCQPVYMPDSSVRRVDSRYASHPHRVSFADAFPFLLVSQASLEDLNSRLETPVPMNRFRPNIVVDGCGPYEEDLWLSFHISGIAFRTAKACSRCVTTTVDQFTGVMGKEPLATLARYRGKGGKVLFGQNLIHEGSGVMQTGDVVEVDRKRQ